MRSSQPVTIVTGGANGIGEAIARSFVSDGHPVAVVDRDAAGCRRIARWATSLGARFLPVVMDVADLSEHRRAVDRIRRSLGPIGILVNCAGKGVSQSFLRTEPPEFDDVFATNLRGPYFFTQAVVRRMKRGGSILFITSVHQDEPVGDPTYSMSKAALKVLVKELALALAHWKIRVNGVAPGAIRHRLSIERRFVRVPLGKRRGATAEVARMVHFLCSPAASYITGELVTVDGGLSLVNWISTEGMQP